jgi:DNA (cytosine-5)-methyltransferase 1
MPHGREQDSAQSRMGKTTLHGNLKNAAEHRHSAPHTFIDLFAGCGGLSLGLENAGFQPLLVNELNEDALESYLANRDAQNPLLRLAYAIRDVRELTEDRAAVLRRLLKQLNTDYGVAAAHGDVDLVAGGPPCQGYSGIGYRRSYAVEREAVPSNHLFRDMAHIIRVVKPRMFLFENVRGILAGRWSASGEKGEIWQDVHHEFATIRGYTVRAQLVHAKDYGVPQNRPRVLLVGIRNDLGIMPDPKLYCDGFLPPPAGEPPSIPELLGDLVDPAYSNGVTGTTSYPHAAEEGTIQQWLRTDPYSHQIAAAGAALTEHEYSNHRPQIVAKFEHMLANRGAIPLHMRTAKFAQRVLPTSWGKAGPTITATSLPDDYVHYCQPRTLTVREWARLQTFPDWYQFRGKRTTGGLRRAGNPRAGLFDRELPKYTQIGNAVPVLLAQAVGEHFASLLRRAK